MHSSVYLIGPSLQELETSMSGLSIEERDKILNVFYKDMEERETNVDSISDQIKKEKSKPGRILPKIPEESEVKDDHNVYKVNIDGLIETLVDESDDDQSATGKVTDAEVEAFISELTEEEKNQIFEVIRRDVRLEIERQIKISRLRAELALLRRKGVLKAGGTGGGVWAPDPSRSCGRCRSELGRIINRGAICRGCRVRVCKSCRDYDIRGQDWLCPVCHKNMEIAAASGEWVNEFIPNNGKKKASGRLYVPSTAELIKRNIKRSWTISNPSGTQGPQIVPRNDGAPELRGFAKHDLPPQHHPHDLPPNHHPHDLPPGHLPPEDKVPAVSRPVIVAQIPPAQNRMSRPIHTQHPNGPPNGQVRRNVPVRSQSMGVADSGRFYMKPIPIGGPPRFRPPPPPDEPWRPPPGRRLEYNETSSDNEDMDPAVTDYRSWDRRKRNGPHHQLSGVPNNVNGNLNLNQKYKTLEPRSRSGGDLNTLDRNGRRKLPDIPSQSLPRPPKNREQSDSRSRDRAGAEKRSYSHGDDLTDPNRRKLPPNPSKTSKGRDFREPTPDYDTTPPPSESSRISARRNSDSGLLVSPEQKQQITVKRHASSAERPVGRRMVVSQSSPENNVDSDDSIRRKKGSGSGRSHRSQNSQVSTKLPCSPQGPSSGSPSLSHHTPPPVLPPKTRKLGPPTAVPNGSAVTSSPVAGTNDSWRKLTTAAGWSAPAEAAAPATAAAAGGAPQVGATSRTKKQGHNQRYQLQETFVDDGVSVVHIQPGGLNRSASSVTQKVKNTIPKPVRRSKSQLPGTKFVTNIQHGGPVTLVSVSDETGHPTAREFQHIDPDVSPGPVNRGPGLHGGRTFVPAFSGSNTLPKAGLRKKKISPGAETVDDSDIVITKRGGGTTTRIRIGNTARSPVEQERGESSGPCSERVDDQFGWKEQDTQTSLDFSPYDNGEDGGDVGAKGGGKPGGKTAQAFPANTGPRQPSERQPAQQQQPVYTRHQQPFVTSTPKRQGGGKQDAGNKRKYTLQEIEVEGFRDSNSDSEKQSCLSGDSEPEAVVDEEEGVASDFDLNSLIEGDVDDDSNAEEDNQADVKDSNRVEDSQTPVVRYYEPLKDPEVCVDATLSEGEYSEEELGSLAVNLGSLSHRKDSDTEADFLDKDETTRRNLKNKLKELEEELDNALEDGEEEKEAVNNMADDEYSICGSEAGGDDKGTRNRSVKVERDKLRARASFGDSDSDTPHDATPCDTDKYNKSRSDSSDRPRASDNQLFPGDKLNQISGTLAYFKPQSPALKLAETTETSDFDSVSTTSASYIVSHSDLESLCLDDDQLDALINKPDLEDLDQLDASTVTESGSSTGCDSPRTSRPNDAQEDRKPVDAGYGSPFITNDCDLTSGSYGEDSSRVDGGRDNPSNHREGVGATSDSPATDHGKCEGQLARIGGTQGTGRDRTPGATARPVGSQQPNGEEQWDEENVSQSKESICASDGAESSGERFVNSEVDSGDSLSRYDPVEYPGGGSRKCASGVGESDKLGTPEIPRRKGSVSSLIAKFECSRSNTPERSLTPESRSLRSATPDRTPSSAAQEGTSKPVVERSSSGDKKVVLSTDAATTKVGDKTPSPPAEKSTGARPKKSAIVRESASSFDEPSTVENNSSSITCAEPIIEEDKHVGVSQAGEIEAIGGESERVELKGLKEFAQKYLQEQEAKSVARSEASAKGEVLGAEGGEEIDSDIEDIDMPPTIRRNSGAYTSYVFIGANDAANDEAASVVSSASTGSYTDPDNRVTVNVKEVNSSPNTCVVSIQDGRASNISIVSTESSELNTPRHSPNNMDEHFVSEPPELPAKILKVGMDKGHNELQQLVFATRESLRDYNHRARGGEELDHREEFEEEDEPPADRSGLANYFTSTLESSTISRRGRPPVIRAAEKVRRQQTHFEYEDEQRGMMVDYSDHMPYRSSPRTPVLGEAEDYPDEYDEQCGSDFKITEVPVDEDDYSPRDSDNYDDYDPQVQYEIQYVSGDSGEEYLEREDYPMCQPVYDSEEYSEGEPISSGDELIDREEELRGYNRAIDFTLHTIIEESCEDSEPENRSIRSNERKRLSDPSELEKYFFYGVGGGNMDQNIREESEYSDNFSEPDSSYNEHQKDGQDGGDPTALASSRLEKYFMAGFSEDKQPSLDAISDRGNTDDSGSVGSESDGTGQPSPDPKRKKIIRPRGFRSERLSDRGESGAENSSNVEEDSGSFRPHETSYSSESSEDNTAFVSGDGSFDTIKRQKKNKARKASDDRRSDSERSMDSRRSSAVSDGSFLKPTTESALIEPIVSYESQSTNNSKKDVVADKSSPKVSPPITPLPSQIIEVQPAPNDTNKKQFISPSGSEQEPESMKPRGTGSNKESPSTSPPPVGGPVRKHKSRDSGFVGSNDDLLRNEGSHVIHTSSDDTQSRFTDSSSEGEQYKHEHRKPRLEKVSEVSENTEDDCDRSIDPQIVLMTHTNNLATQPGLTVPRKKSNESDVSKEGSEEGSRLSRKDSFNQWSSDEETNIMMNRMRAFFKNMLVNASKGRPLEPTKKPAQIVHFEEQLTRLMKTVPGINDQQVKEIVEYLSSEDTWSDSYDSSDYTDYTSSDLEGVQCRTTESDDPVIPDMDVEIQEQISASCQEIIQKFEGTNSQKPGVSEVTVEQEEFQKETAIMYQKLMSSVAKMQHSQDEQEKETELKRSPPIAAKILHHISSRLVTLMHEVSGSDNSSTASLTDSRQNLRLSQKDFRNHSVTSSPKPKFGNHRHRQLEASSSNDSTKHIKNSSGRYKEDSPNTEENGRDKLAPVQMGEPNENSYTFNSLDSPKVLMGPNLGASPKTNPFKFTKNTSKSVEVLDLGRRRASLDDKSLKMTMAKSTSTDYDVWQGVHRDVDQRRGSLPRGQLELLQSPHSSSSGVSDILGDDERFSWKGSFESALAADSRTRLSIEAKRRSIGSDCNSEIFSSVEQVDKERNGSHTSSKSSLITSRSPSQSSKRSLKSSLPNSRSSLIASRSEKDINRNSEFSTTPTSELSTKLSINDSDSDTEHSVSVPSSVRSSTSSSRYGRRSSIPETQVQARLAPPEEPIVTTQSRNQDPNPPTVTLAPPVVTAVSSTRQHSTNSLPRLGTNSLQKTKSTSSTLISAGVTATSHQPSQPSNNIITTCTTSGQVRSARYRPHGYKPPPARKMSPASSGPSRKSSIDSIGRFTDEASELSSKSATPSPLLTRVGAIPTSSRSTSDLVRDFRESSVGSRASSEADDRDERELSVERFGPAFKSGSMSSLGTRSESMASVYSQGEGRYGTVLVKGDIEFGFMYSFGSGSLEISIKQCRDLAAVDLKRNRSDPYVKVYLLPDKSKSGKRKTKVKKHTLNPVFEEILRFTMPLSEVQRRTMWLSVWHSDMFGRNDFLGEVMMQMSGQIFDDPSAKWHCLQDRTEPPEDESASNSKGDIIVALKYIPADNSRAKKRKGMLMILIKEAKNLPVPKGTTLPDPFCKCYLLPEKSGKAKQKTAVCRRTTSPRWEQTISWEDLALQEVADRCLEVTVWDHDRLGHSDFLGGVRFNLGTGKQGGRPSSWMDATGKEVTLWQQMLDRPNFWVEGSVTLRQQLDGRTTEK